LGATGFIASALETFSVAWDIVHNPKRFQAWMVDKKFDSTPSISSAKEVNEVIGKLNGLLSKNEYPHKPTKQFPSNVFKPTNLNFNCLA